MWRKKEVKEGVLLRTTSTRSGTKSTWNDRVKVKGQQQKKSASSRGAYPRCGIHRWCSWWHHTGKHYLLHCPHRSTIDTSTISNCTYNCAGRNLQPSAQYCNDVSGKLVGTQALCHDVLIAELSQTIHWQSALTQPEPLSLVRTAIKNHWHWRVVCHFSFHLRCLHFLDVGDICTKVWLICQPRQSFL